MNLSQLNSSQSQINHTANHPLQKPQILNGFTLKLIAIITMAIDHIGACLFPNALWLRCIGRISFPIFCFLLVEGFLHTHNRPRYLIRLCAFALLSEIPFDLAFYGEIYWDYQNVFFTLALGFLCMLLLESRQKHPCLYSILFLLAFVGAALLRTDYQIPGILLILVFYVFHDNKLGLAISSSLILVLCMGWIEAFGILALIPVFLYNQKRGPAIKYSFYLFYPAHLLLLWLCQ